MNCEYWSGTSTGYTIFDVSQSASEGMEIKFPGCPTLIVCSRDEADGIVFRSAYITRSDAGLDDCTAVKPSDPGKHGEAVLIAWISRGKHEKALKELKKATGSNSPVIFVKLKT